MTGAFILIDEHTNDTVGAGVVDEAPRGRAATPRAPRRDLAPVGAGARAPLGAPRPARRDGVADRAARVGQVDDRGGARARAWSRPAAPPTCSTATTSATACQRRPRLRARRPRGEHPPRRPGRAAVRRRRRRRRRVARLARWPPTARCRAGCTRRPSCRSWRSTSTPTSRSARGATPRACTTRPAPASSRASPASTRPTRRPRTPRCGSTRPPTGVERAVDRILDAAGPVKP